MKLNEMLDERVEEIKRFVESLIETYQMSLNTTNEDFISELLESSTILDDVAVSNITEKPKVYYDEQEEKEYIEQPVSRRGGKIIIERSNEEKNRILKQMLSGTEELREKTSNQVNFNKELIKYYFLFVKKIIADFVPKRIQHKMVQHVVDHFETYLIKHLFEPFLVENKIDEILNEDENIIKLRIKSEMTLAAVKKALSTMNEIQYFST